MSIICPVCSIEVRLRSRGRPPHYCSQRCRQAAYRQRKACLPVANTQVAEVASAKPAGSDDQVARALLEARMVAGAFLRLGTVARPPFAWRCSKAGAEIREALDKYFPIG